MATTKITIDGVCYTLQPTSKTMMDVYFGDTKIGAIGRKIGATAFDMRFFAVGVYGAGDMLFLSDAVRAAIELHREAQRAEIEAQAAEAEQAEQIEAEQAAPAELPAPQFKKLEALLEAKKQNDDKRIAIDAAFIQSEIDRIRKTMDKAAHIALQLSPYRIQYNDRFILNIYSAHAHVSLVLEYTGGFFPVTGYVRNNSGDSACYTNAKVIEKSDYYFVDSDAILKTAFSAVDLDVIDNFIVNLLSKKHSAKRDFDINI